MSGVVQVAGELIATRRVGAYQPPAQVGNGVLAKYAKLVSSASEGAITR